MVHENMVRFSVSVPKSLHVFGARLLAFASSLHYRVVVVEDYVPTFLHGNPIVLMPTTVGSTVRYVLCVLKLASGINPRIIKRALKPRQGNHGNPKGRHAAPKGVLIVVALQGAASSFIRLLSAVSPLHDLSILCIQDMSPLVLGCCARELNTTIACSALFDHDSLLKSGHCFLLRDRFLPALTIDEQGSVFLINEERSGRMHRFLQDASKIFGENICVCILGGPALEDIQPLDEIRKAGGKIIALSPERCACGEFSRTAAREFMAEILDSEQAVWAKIRAFSRRVMLKQASKRK